MTTARKPPPVKPTVRLEQVSAAMADKWLGTQEHNRDLSSDRVRFWMDVIERGEWRLTNDCISFDTEGHLLNGQHRLTAIAASEVTVPLAVMRGLPRETQDVMDSGLVRRTADALKLRGEVQVFALAAGLRWEHRLRGIESGPDDASPHFGTHSESRPSTPQLLRIFDEDSDHWREFVRVASAMSRQVKVRPGVGAALFRRFYALNADDLAGFHEALLTGANLAENDPILRLRNALQPSRQRGRDRLSDFREAALIIKAWNLWRDGERTGNLTWHYGGVHRESFPVPH